MKVFVDLIYTIAVEVDHDEYETTTDDELLEACRNDPDFALGRLHNGPHDLYDVDWKIASLWDYQAAELDKNGPDGFEVEVRRKRTEAAK